MSFSTRGAQGNCNGNIGIHESFVLTKPVEKKIINYISHLFVVVSSGNKRRVI